MLSFQELSAQFNQQFDTQHFPATPNTLYAPGEYFLTIGGKRIRPVMCMMGNELFSDIHPDAFVVARAIELFHNFTLVHDDMMDEANLRRGMPTVHTKYDSNTALLVGDVMLIRAYEFLQNVQPSYLPKILKIFNKTAREVCEGQQLDMDFSKMEQVNMEQYIHMITLKTSVLLAASLEIGAIIGGASESNCHHLYEFGKKVGIAFQIQDDYLDAYGDAAIFGKEPADKEQSEALELLLKNDDAQKVDKVLAIFNECGVGAWAENLKAKYLQEAFDHLESIAVVSARKQPLIDLANYLMSRNK
jgi:geranylgeranyl diphosphate synthase type II